MLEFVNIENEIALQNKDGSPAMGYGLQYAQKTKPLPFQYVSTEAVSTFVVKKLDSFGLPLETTNLSTSLIYADGESHYCDGLTNYAANLDFGSHYFLVNSKYQSDTFSVITDLSDGLANQTKIGVSGLDFFDNTYTISWRNKQGSPDLFFGLQFTENNFPLPFIYMSSDISITTFKAIKLNNVGRVILETDLSTLLITSDGTYHSCSGLTAFSSQLSGGIYYLEVNGRYESEIFSMIELNEVFKGIGYDIIGSTLIVY